MNALSSFALYLVAVFILAALSNRIRSKKEFVSEYFLGSRGLGAWAFALTFAATNASGGSFIGFPALIYGHGWTLALWIAGYMAVPLITTGLIAKRLNHVSRMAGAVTIPDLLRERFANPKAGLVAAGVLTFFMFFYLLAQFKAGASILATLLSGIPLYDNLVNWVADWTGALPFLGGVEPDYLLCLFFFGLVVIVYTAYGGFRAVVWTDVLQGIIMVLGVGIMLVLIISQVGSLESATKQLAKQIPPENGLLRLETKDENGGRLVLPKGSWVLASEETSGRPFSVRTFERVVLNEENSEGERVGSVTVKALVFRETDGYGSLPTALEGADFSATLVESTPYAQGGGKRGGYVRAPGPHSTEDLGFLSMSMAFSFFVFWCFGGAGQPGNMVRQMAFRDSLTLKRSIAMVAVYYSLIYFPLVIIFCCARILIPGMEVSPDRVMPEVARHLTTAAGVPWLTGLIIAAPFAAVMSSVDSFLLIVSSGLVRDIYQRNINPQASEAKVRKLSYLATGVVGCAAVVAMINPPQYLQILSVFASGGLAACFLVPIALTLFWRRMTAAAAIWGMLAGAIAHLTLYIVGFLQTGKFTVYQFLGLQPFIWDILLSLVVALLVARATEAPDNKLVEKYFGSSPLQS